MDFLDSYMGKRFLAAKLLRGEVLGRCSIPIDNDAPVHVRRLAILGACREGVAHATKYATFREAWDACTLPLHLDWCMIVVDRPVNHVEGMWRRSDAFRSANECPPEYDLPVPGEPEVKVKAAPAPVDQAEPRPRRARKKSPAKRKAPAAGSVAGRSTRKGRKASRTSRAKAPAASAKGRGSKAPEKAPRKGRR